MKKFFTLIAAVAMAASMNAQGTYAVAEGEVPNAKSEVSSVPNIKMTWGDDRGKTTNWLKTNLLISRIR